MTGTLSAKHYLKGIEGEDWRELFDAYNEMSRPVGVKRPQEAQEAKALEKMKAATDGGEEFYDPERKETFWEERERDWHCGKSTSKTQPWDLR